jgi:branched-chain amino acid transport system substrate-binding protein
MKRALEEAMPFAVAVSLEKFAGDIRVARLKRGLTAEQVARSLGVHRSTYGRLEAGDPAVSIGLYAAALYVLGLGLPFGDLADPRRDEEGQLLDLIRLPKRARARRDRPISVRLPQIGALPARAAEPVLKIGVLGAMSGPAAPWGLASKHSAEVTAEMYNDAGGVEISGERYRVQIVSYDDGMQPGRAAEGARFLTETEGVRYIIGPNVEQTITAATPVAERNRAMLFPYSFTRALYSPPHENAVLCQIANYQAAPRIYQYLMESEGVETISIVSPSTPEGLRQRTEIMQIAKRIGLRVISGSGVYRSGADDIEHSLGPALATMPDVLALPNLAPRDSVALISHAREMGFSGPITTEAAQDAELLINSIGSRAEGLVMLGGASPINSRNERMRDFMARYVRLAGHWNDEAGTKVHTLELILATLQMAGSRALNDIDEFKATIPHFSIENPMSNRRSQLTYCGDRDLRHKRQIGIPLVVNTISGGELKNLFTEEPNEFLH